MMNPTCTCRAATNDAPGIEVIGAGMGRTGTKSLQAALDLLGYRTYHFPLPKHAETWARFADGDDGVSSEDVFAMIARDGFTATCDNPSADCYAQQLAQFPRAKVVLTVRDSGAKWAASWRVLMRFVAVQERPFSLAYPTFVQWVPFMRAWKRMRGLIGTHLGLAPGALVRGWAARPDADAWLAAQYEAHNAQVRARVPPAQLLVFNVKEGWAPLCAFLGKVVPDVPFPHVNESAEIELATKLHVAVSYAWIPAVVAMAAVAVRAWRGKAK